MAVDTTDIGGIKQNNDYNKAYTLKDLDHDEIKDGYQLRWVGKNYAKLQENLRPETVIVPDFEHNTVAENKDSQNLFLTGDNLEVLKHLEYAYTGKVDVIYIDPPYNTGSDGFIYSDNFKFTDQQLRDTLGLTDVEVQKIRNIYGKASHSAWLTFMYPRLKLAKKLLKDTGVIFVSIDDNEQANLKLLMDEVFSGNFCNEFVWINNLKGRLISNVGSSKTSERILCYGKNLNEVPEFRGSKTILTKLMPSSYKMKDYTVYTDEIGQYVIKNELYNSNSVFNEETRPNLVFDIYFRPNDGDILVSDISEEHLHDGYVKIVPHKNSDGAHKYHAYRWSKDKIFADKRDLHFDVDKAKVYTKIRDIDTITLKDIITDIPTSKGSSDIEKIGLSKKMFSFPKPVELIKTIVGSTRSKEALVLDFFAGSGTTADAVMRLNKEDGGNRKYIMCTLDEPINSTKEAKKAGYNTIDEIARKRIELAAKYLDDQSGFRHYRFISSSEQTLEKIEDFDPSQTTLVADDMITPFSEHTLTGQGSDDGAATILATWLVDDGYDFNTRCEILELSGYKVHYARDIARLYLIADKNWTDESCKTLLNLLGKNELAVNAIVIYAYSFTHTQLIQIKNNLNANLDKAPQLIERY